MNTAEQKFSPNQFMTVTEWKNREFAEGSRPQNRTVREWIKKREIIGSFIGNLAYVRCDQRAATLNDIDNAVAELVSMSQ